MKVYNDILNGDEMISDSYKLEKRFQDACIEVKSRLVVKGAAEVDIGRGNQFGGGGEDEAVEDTQEKVNDIVDAFRYTETSFSKADYGTYIKGYMKKIKTKLEATNPDRVATFMAGAKEMFAWITKEFDNFQFFMGEKCDPDAHIVLAYYKEDTDEAPHFVYWADGLKAKTV